MSRNPAQDWSLGPSLSLHLRSDCHKRQNSLEELVLHAHVTSQVPTIQFKKHTLGDPNYGPVRSLNSPIKRYW